ncbi:hypothetical protein BCR35DRAFT_308361 [Leucosporidium creatinivorum]|uniref:Uncharacterized protein n=1 Tax=Leucosporidium creatinivorum TaxID=106004 RepID=A0A1Y2E6L4_9BASI|nr:hypothetical protein BCR35DRAFT_308361 [Leucosporidium creatinivorum]
MSLWGEIDWSKSKKHSMHGLHYARRAPIVKIRQASDEESSHERAPLSRSSSITYHPSPGSSIGSEEEQWSAEEEEEEEEDELDAQEDHDIRARYQYRRSSSLHFDDALVFHPTNSPSSTSPLPSLSPSRPRLFDDDSEDDDEDDEALLILRTPSSSSSSPASLSTKSSGLKPVDRKPTSTDPLLSPPSSSPTLAHAFGRRTSAGWLPTPPRTQDRRLSTSSSELASPAPPTSTTTSQPSISLLTKSLRSLARLPNLALEQPAPLQPPLTALDLQGLGTVEENPWEWRGGRGERSAVDEAWEVPQKRAEGSNVVSASSAPLLRRLPPALVDNEHATVVQLQTFSSPSPPSPPRKTIDLPPLAPAPAVVVEEEEPLPLSPPITRYISNPRHLLMISLELSMMRADKIRSPLRPRAVVVRCGGPSQAMGSGLRFEVQA